MRFVPFAATVALLAAPLPCAAQTTADSVLAALVGPHMAPHVLPHVAPHVTPHLQPHLAAVGLVGPHVFPHLAPNGGLKAVSPQALQLIRDVTPHALPMLYAMMPWAFPELAPFADSAARARRSAMTAPALTRGDSRGNLGRAIRHFFYGRPPISEAELLHIEAPLALRDPVRLTCRGRIAR